jgi:hypothetical protein
MAEANIKRQQIEYIAVGLLVLVALLVGITRFKKKDKDDEVFSRKEFSKKWEEVEILEKKVPQEEKGISYAVRSERIPFKSPFEEEEKVEEKVDEELTLPAMGFQGMVWSSKRPQAIINSKVYDVGDVIPVGLEEVVLKGIERDGIHLKYKGKEFIVRPK